MLEFYGTDWATDLAAEEPTEGTTSEVTEVSFSTAQAREPSLAPAAAADAVANMPPGPVEESPGSGAADAAPITTASGVVSLGSGAGSPTSSWDSKAPGRQARL